MMSKKSPQLRFEGFTDDWEERKLENIAQINKGIQRGKQEISSVRNELNPYPVYNGGKKASGYTDECNRENSVMVSEGGASAGYVNYYSGKYWSGGHNFTISNDTKHDTFFLLYVLQKSQEKLYKLQVGTGLPNIQLKSIKDFPIYSTSNTEQQKIGSFFKQLDNIIALHQRKLDLLKEQKKGFLQKMFPKNGAKVPELRFAGFVDDWEQRKLSDLMTFSNGINAPKENYGKGTKMISVMDILNPLPIKYDNILNSVSVDKKIEDKNKVENGDLIFVRSSEIVEEVGWAKAYKEARYALYSGFAIRGKRISSYNAYFIELTLNYANRKEIERRAGGSTRFNVSQEILNSLTVLTPSISEQNQIDLFFTKIDDTITLHQRKLDLLKEQKKGFLQKMFV